MILFTFEQAKQIRLQAVQRGRAAEAVMSTFPKGSMGLTLELVKATQEWKDAYLESCQAFEAERTINGLISKHFKKENRADIDAERAARLATSV